MSNRLLQFVPHKIREKLGADSTVCLLSGRDVFLALAAQSTIVMGCNPRIPHVVPGIMRAAEEMDAVVAFELTKTEGGVDGGYTGQTPATFASTIIGYAERCRFSRPFIIHGDHITIKNTSNEEVSAAAELIKAQLDAGYTSFAVDASFNELSDNIDIVVDLTKDISADSYGLEVELGEKRLGEDHAGLTSVEETREFLTGLVAKGVVPQLLAIENGSKRGNYLEGEMVNIDLERTLAIFETARSFGTAGLVQHGITGTPLRIVGKLAEYGVRKGNIGTLWQNVAHAGLPLDLMDAMRKWSRENRRDIKYATGYFRDDIASIPKDNAKQIEDMAYREAKEFLAAFHAKGSASRLAAAMEER